MNTSAIVMMVISILFLWGGLGAVDLAFEQKPRTIR